MIKVTYKFKGKNDKKWIERSVLFDSMDAHIDGCFYRFVKYMIIGDTGIQRDIYYTFPEDLVIDIDRNYKRGKENE